MPQRFAATVVLLGSLLTGVSPGGATPRPFDDLVLVHGSDGVVGPVIDIGPPTTATVLIEDEGEVFPLRVTGDRFLQGTARVVFIDPDCQTAPFIRVDAGTGSDVAPRAGVGPGQTLVVENGAPQGLIVASQWSASLDPPACDTFQIPNPVLAAAGIVRLELAARFPGPYRVQPPAGGRAARLVPRLLDGSEVPVGRVVNVTLFPVEVLVEVELDGAPALARFDRDRLRGGTAVAVVYAAGDCSGPPLVAVGPTGLPEGVEPFGRVTGLARDQVFVVQDGPLLEVNVGSFWDPVTPGCVAAADSATAAAAVPLAGFVFDPPFDLALGPPAGDSRRGPREVTTVVDLGGQLVGPAFPVSGPFGAQVAVRAGAEIAPAQVTGSALAGWRPAVFVAGDCSGPALHEVSDTPGFAQPLFPQTVMDDAGRLRAPSGPAAPTVVASVLISALPRRCLPFDPPVQQTVAPTVPIADLSHLRPPMTPR